MNPFTVKPWVVLLSYGIVFVFGCYRAEGTDWKLYHTSDTEFYFYDAESIVKSEDVTKVSERSVLRLTQRYNLTEALKEVRETKREDLGGQTAESSEKTIKTLALQETRRLFEIRCSKRMGRLVTGMEYDKEGTLIDAVLSSPWGRVKPDSILGKLYEAVCR